MTSVRAYNSQAPARSAISRDARAVIGPNAAIQLAAALTRAGQQAMARDLFVSAGVGDWLDEPPTRMIDELRAARLHQGLRDRLAWPQAREILADAGRLTGDYIFANRIPGFFRVLLRFLPRGLGLRLLLDAIARHAWTFVGTGEFRVRRGRPIALEIQDNPLCARERRAAPICVWHAAVFERLFQRLVSRDARVEEIQCEAAGDACCRFVLRWAPPEPAKP